MKKVSIIVPIYNVHKYLERLSICLINQTYKNIEIIFVDDGSTDGSGIICDELSKKDKRIKVIHQKNSGVSVARNVGIANATGDYIAFVDSDDMLSLNIIEILYNNLICNDCDVSVCNYLTFKNESPDFLKENSKEKVIILNKFEVLKDLLLDGVITNFLWNKLFKKELFEGILFPNGKIYEDVFVLTRIFQNVNKVCYDTRKLYGYYQRNDSYVNSFTKEKNKDYFEICYDRYNSFLKYKNIEEANENYKCFFIYSAFLQAAKSHCKDIINSSEMNKEYNVFKKNFKSLNKNVSIKRKILYYILYLNKSLFYYIVTFIR